MSFSSDYSIYTLRFYAFSYKNIHYDLWLGIKEVSNLTILLQNYYLSISHSQEYILQAH